MLNGATRNVLSACLIAACLSLPACDRSSDGSREPQDQPLFTLLDKTDSGIGFSHINGASGRLHMAETMGAGAALLDYDNDGDLDIYLVQGSALSGNTGNTGNAHDTGLVDILSSDRLYRNDLEVAPDGTRRLGFTDVTNESGITATGYGMGVASDDFDNDGWPDLYVTNVGPNQLWRITGNGRFEDVTVSAGVAGEGEWSTSAVFLDYDGDRMADLYVANYIAERLADPKRCYARNSIPDYCNPRSYPAQTNRLYRNLGGGEFSDVTATSGVGSVSAASLGLSLIHI